MPGSIVNISASVICSHGGKATPAVPFPFVLANNQPIITIASPYMIAACPFPPTGTPVPCVTGQWLMGSSFVLAGGQPVVLNTGTSTCVPNGTPMMVLAVQPFAFAT